LLPILIRLLYAHRRIMSTIMIKSRRFGLSSA